MQFPSLLLLTLPLPVPHGSLHTNITCRVHFLAYNPLIQCMCLPIMASLSPGIPCIDGVDAIVAMHNVKNITYA